VNETIDPQTLRKFLKIITEQSNGQWSSWFEDAPQIAVGGSWPVDAIRRLLEHYGAHHFDERGIMAIDAAVRPDHLEFLIPLLRYRRIPSPSVN
jgi:hypothetical protein